MDKFAELQQAIIDGAAPLAKELTRKMLDDGTKPSEFFPKAIIPAMDEGTADDHHDEHEGSH
jgi:methanogenic corrinoid protein MtbC1